MPRRILLLLLLLASGSTPARDTRALVTGIDSIGLTVSDLGRAVAFYTNVLTFEKISEFEADGPEYEHLQGVFGLRMRTARLRLGDEWLELTQYLAPKGRPVPVDSRRYRPT